jgi:hypothetical protein
LGHPNGAFALFERLFNSINYKNNWQANGFKQKIMLAY